MCLGRRCGMSFLAAQPGMMTVAATELANLCSTLTEANAAAAASTTELLAAGADEVSAAVAALFGAHAQGYQAVSAHAAAFHQQFVQALNVGAGLYAGTEAANANPLQTLEQQLLNAINTPTQLLLGRPLIGNGANGAPGSGANGGDGGILWGNGGARGVAAHPGWGRGRQQ